MQGEVNPRQRPTGCKAEAALIYGPLTDTVPEGEAVVQDEQLVLICGDRLTRFPARSYDAGLVATGALKGFCVNCPNRVQEPSPER